jgi:hypothetical protein
MIWSMMPFGQQKGIATVYVVITNSLPCHIRHQHIFYFVPLKVFSILRWFLNDKRSLEALKVHIMIRWVPWLHPIIESTRLPFSQWFLLLRHTSNIIGVYGMFKWALHMVVEWANTNRADSYASKSCFSNGLCKQKKMLWMPQICRQ